MHQLAPHRLGEALDGVFGAAVRRLQGDPSVGERGSDLHDRSGVPWHHPGERRAGSGHEAEVGHLGDALELLRFDVQELGEHRGERHVHPHVDGAEFAFHPFRGGLHLIRFGHVGGDGERPATRPFDVVGRGLQADLTPGEQRDCVSAGAEGECAGSTDTGARPGDDHDSTVAGHGARLPQGPGGKPAATALRRQPATVRSRGHFGRNDHCRTMFRHSSNSVAGHAPSGVVCRGLPVSPIALVIRPDATGS